LLLIYDRGHTKIQFSQPENVTLLRPKLTFYKSTQKPLTRTQVVRTEMTTLAEFFSRMKSICFWSYFGVSSILLFPLALGIWLITVRSDPQLRLLHRLTCWWASHYITLFPFWRLQLENMNLFNEETPQIILANHQSMGDILVLFALRKHFKWVAKESLFQVPFIGWNMSLNQYVPLKRTGLGSIKQMMRDCVTHLQRGSSVLLFPEGTRSMDGAIKDFKLGAFRLACHSKLPILPIVINGTFEALPKSGWVLRQQNPIDITLRVLDPIHPSTTNYDPTILSTEIRRRMAAELSAIRRENSVEARNADHSSLGAA